MDLEIRTLLVVVGFVLLSFGLTIGAVWSAERQRQNVGFSAAAYVGIGAACLFMALAHWSQDSLAIGADYLLACAGFLLLWRSVRIGFRRPSVVAEIALIVGAGAALALCTAFRSGVNSRVIVASIFMFVVSILAMQELSRNPRNALRAHGVLMFSAFFGIALLMSVLVSAVVLEGNIPAYMQSDPRAALALLIWMLLLVVLGCGMLWSSFARIDDELKLRNRELEVAREAMERANEAKSTFLASMSHDLRTPMSAVLGIADLLLESPLTPEQRYQLTTLKDSERSLLAFIDDLFDLSKMEVGKLRIQPEPTHLASLVNQALETLMPAANAKGIRLRADLSGDLPDWIEVDPRRLRQILINLAHNAIKFTERGQVLVAAYKDAAQGHPQLRFEVRDTGIGIRADAQERLFKDFEQIGEASRPRHDGTGLGLAICRRLTEAMGGSVGVRSTPGAGSTFWFTIDMNQMTSPALVPPAALEREPRNLRILVAEDSGANRIVIDAMLRQEGHEAVTVDKGTAALEALKEDPFDLILMDIDMPEMDGITTSCAIRELCAPRCDTPIVAITAATTPGEKEHCQTAGMDDCLMKPIDRATLKRTIAQWTSVLDFDALRALEEQIGHSNLSELVEAFCVQLSNDVSTIATASEPSAMLRAIHKLISGSGYLGCKELTQASRDLMDAIKDERRLAPFLARFNAAARRTETTMAANYLDPAGRSPAAPPPPARTVFSDPLRGEVQTVLDAALLVTPKLRTSLDRLSQTTRDLALLSEKSTAHLEESRKLLERLRSNYIVTASCTYSVSRNVPAP